MNKRTMKLSLLGVGVLLTVAVLCIPLLAEPGECGRGDKAQGGHAASRPAHHRLHETHVKKLHEAMKAMDEAVKAVQADQKHKALSELHKARGLVSACYKAMMELDRGKIVNVRCPMMGMKLQPDKMSAKLTRTYKGRKVGFCCPECLGAWDRLSEGQKDRKLLGSLPAGTEGADKSHKAKGHHRNH